MYPSSYNKNGSWPSFCGFRFLLRFVSICLFAASTLFYVSYSPGAPVAPQYGITVRTLLIHKFGTPNLALYALAPNHVFGQYWVARLLCLLPYVPLHRLG